MKKKWLRPVILFLCLFFVGIQLPLAGTERQLVIVNSIDSPVTSISFNEFRKLFLGVPIIKKNLKLKPLLNYSDSELENIFLQKIVFMSKRNYERRLLSRVFRQGGERPTEYDNFYELISALNKTDNALSYVWSDQIRENDHIKIIGVLWSGQTD